MSLGSFLFLFVPLLAVDSPYITYDLNMKCGCTIRYASNYPFRNYRRDDVMSYFYIFFLCKLTYHLRIFLGYFFIFRTYLHVFNFTNSSFFTRHIGRYNGFTTIHITSYTKTYIIMKLSITLQQFIQTF